MKTRNASSLVAVLLVLACTPWEECSAQQDLIEPIPIGTISHADRNLLSNFLSNFKSHGTYHVFGRTTLHSHGTDPVHTDAKAELIYSGRTNQFLIRSNRLYRIWGDYYDDAEDWGVRYTVVDVDRRDESHPCGSPLGLERGATAKESISMFAAMPFLVVADMLQNSHFIDDMLQEVNRLRFEQNFASRNRRYIMTLELRDGGIARFSFDSQERFLTHVRHDFPADVWPEGATEMFVEWLAENAPEPPHRGQPQFHTELINTGIRNALAVVPRDDDGDHECAEAVGTQVTKVPQKSVLEDLLDWLFGD